jgi:pseudouridine-5'-monophosphatase
LQLRAQDAAKILVDSIQLPITPDEYLESRRQLLEELFPQAEPMPGAVRLTRHLHRHGIPQAIASSSDRRHFELKTSRHNRDWFSVFQCVVVGVDPEVKHGKPAPDVFIVAARRLGADPSSCLVFEDAPAAVTAACAAGMAVIAVADPNINQQAFAGAEQVLRSLTEFDPVQWGLPGY